VNELIGVERNAGVAMVISTTSMVPAVRGHDVHGLRCGVSEQLDTYGHLHDLERELDRGHRDIELLDRPRGRT
jgi:hypothetical protein